jgi:hypothetical protein
MRSRFWIGGRYAGARSESWLDEAVLRVARHFMTPRPENGYELLVHCS